MTQDEIIEMARHIADTFGTRMCDEHGDTHGEELYAMGIDDIVETIKLVAAKEIEACAKVCDDALTKIWEYHSTEVKSAAGNVCSNLATAIRARGNT